MGTRVATARAVSVAVTVALVAVVSVIPSLLPPDGATRLVPTHGTAGIVVAYGAAGLLGRVGPQSGTIDATIAWDAGATELVQASDSVLAIERGRGLVSLIDAASMTVGARAPLPSPDAQLLLVAGHDVVMDVVILAPRDGRLWRVPVPELDEFEPTSPALLVLGPGAAVAAGPAGALYAASPRDGAVYRLDAPEPARHASFEPFAASAGAPAQLAVTGGGWWVLDAGARRVLTGRGAVDLGGDAVGGLALEAPAFAMYPGAEDTVEVVDTVFVADAAGLLEVSADAVHARRTIPGADPRRPLRLGECVYGAWGASAHVIGCGDARAGSAVAASTPATAGGARPVLLTDGHTVVANDAASGMTWTLDAAGARPVRWDAGRAKNEPEAEGMGTVLVPAPEDDEAPTAPTTRPEGRGGAPADPGTDPRDGSGRAGDSPHPGVGGPGDGAYPGAGTSPGPGANPNPGPNPNPGATAPGADGPDSHPNGGPNDPDPGGDSLTPGRVEARADPAHGTIVVSWSPFASADAPVLGYLVQRLAPGEVSGPCVPSGGSASVTGGVVHAAPSTSTVFGGGAPPPGGYRFVVWGYTATACVAGDPVTVLPEPVPAAVTDPRGAMEWIGTRYDYVIRPGDAPRYELRRLDAAGAPTGASRAFSGEAVPRELTGGLFGEAVRFELRACTIWGGDAACGPWTEHAAPEPSLDFTLADLAYSEERSEWTWTALPDNGDLRIRVLAGGLAEVPWENGDFHARAVSYVSPDEARLTLILLGRTLTLSARDY